MFISSFVTFNERKNIKTCHFCVFSAFEKIVLNFFPIAYCIYCSNSNCSDTAKGITFSADKYINLFLFAANYFDRFGKYNNIPADDYQVSCAAPAGNIFPVLFGKSGGGGGRDKSKMLLNRRIFRIKQNRPKCIIYLISFVNMRREM